METPLSLAQAMFEIGVDPGRIWIWINGLKTYGEGETWEEARADALREIETALDSLWAARNEQADSAE